MKKTILISFFIFQLCSCAIPISGYKYKPIVDTSSVSDMRKYQKEYRECETITNTVDYSDPKIIAALKEVALGARVVGLGMAVSLAAGSIMLAPVVVPIYGIVELVGARKDKAKTYSEEQKMRAIVWNSCLKDRGYKVFSDPIN